MPALSTLIEEMPEQEEVFGIDFWSGSSEEAVRMVDGWLGRAEYFTLAFANPEFILNAHENPPLLDYLRRCRTVFADGAGILWASRIQGGRIRERITGTDFQWEIFKLVARRGQRLFLYGGKPGIADAARRLIQERIPELTQVGACHGYLEEADALAEIQAFQPDVLLVCLGNPRQEQWIARHGPATRARLVFGNGGSLDFIAGKVQRAPKWMCDNGFEWLWRLFQDPSWARIRRQLRLVLYVGKLSKLRFTAK